MSGRVTKSSIVYARADIPAWEKAQVESVEVLTKGEDDCFRTGGGARDLEDYEERRGLRMGKRDSDSSGDLFAGS